MTEPASPQSSEPRNERFSFLLALIDTLFCILAWNLGGILTRFGDPRNEGTLLLVVLCAYLLQAWLNNIYDPVRHSSAGGGHRIVQRGWMRALLLAVVVIFLTRNSLAETPQRMVVTLVAGAVFLSGWRLLQTRLLPRFAERYITPRRVLIIGGQADAERVLSLYGGSRRVQIVGFCDDRERRTRSTEKLAYLGAISNVPKITIDQHVSDIFIALPWYAEDRIASVAGRLRFLPVRILLAPEAILLRLPPSALSTQHGFAAPLLSRPPISPRGWWMKDVFDRSVAAVILLLASPLFLATMLAVRLSGPGPIFFRQQRLGLHKKLFYILKFRSLRHEQADARADRLVTKGDSRVTPIGRFIRKFSLDELPQIVNVLKGDMSLVGPRPHAIGAKAGGILYDKALPDYDLRYRVKPGMTGWAQVNGWRGDTDTTGKLRHRVEFDFYYIANWSFLLDLWILLRTVRAVLAPKNAG